MYFTNVGGSMLLHVLAGHPRLVAALGIAASVAVLSSPLGPGAHLGTEKYAARIERALGSQAHTTQSAYARAERTVNRLIATRDREVPRMIEAALRECGANCSDLGVDLVMKNPRLERDVLMMAALDEHARPTAAGEGGTNASGGGR
jgi:phosphate uptake regulator